MPENVKEFVMSWRNRKNKTTTKESPVKKIVNINNDIKYKYDQNELVKVLNLLPSKYYDDYKYWMTITSALKSAGLKNIWEQFSKKSSTFDYDNNNNIWDGLEPRPI